MAVKVNPEIEEYIDNSKYDKKIKECLKEILVLDSKVKTVKEMKKYADL